VEEAEESQKTGLLSCVEWLVGSVCMGGIIGKLYV
jgi:hypothetical protein